MKKIKFSKKELDSIRKNPPKLVKWVDEEAEYKDIYCKSRNSYKCYSRFFNEKKFEFTEESPVEDFIDGLKLRSTITFIENYRIALKEALFKQQILDIANETE